MNGKILKKTLLISILAISLFYTSEVRAEGPIKAQGCVSKLISTTKITRSSCKITVNGLRANANFYEFKVGDSIALCLNPGKKMANDLKYSLESITPVSNTLIQKAYTYAVKNSEDLAARIAAQTVVWYVSQHGNIINEEEIEKAICSAITSGKKSGSKCSGSLKETCTGAWQKIQNIDPEYTVYYYRVYSNNQTDEYQRLVSTLSISDLEKYIKEKTGKVNGKDYSLNFNVNLQELVTSLDIPNYETTCKSECDLLVESDLADCGDYNSKVDSNSGRVYQKTTGVCKSGYKTETEAKVTLDGTIAQSSGDGNYWNIRCLDSLVQTYPGNVKTAINVGRYIVWPNNNLNEIVKKANLPSYKMMLSYEKSCKININSDEYKKDYSESRNEMEKENVRASVNDEIREYVNVYTDPTTYTLIDPLDAVINYVINNEKCDNYSSTAETAKENFWACFGINGGNDNGNCDDALKAMNQSAALSSACTHYLTNYNKAKVVLKSFKSIIAEANTFNRISFDNFDAKFKVSYNDPEYKNTYDLVQIDGSLKRENLGNIAVSNIPDKPNNVSVQTFNSYFNTGSYVDQAQSVTAKISRYNYYDLNQKQGLPSNGITRAYIKKVNLKFENKKPEGSNKYSTVGFVNMPISFSADKNMPATGYELSLELNELKSNFMNAEIKNAILSHKYTCHYKVVKETPTPCKCPENSNAPGRDLTCEINSWNKNHKEKLTCPDGQIKYCYTDNASSEDEFCSEEFVCPEDTDTPGYDLSTCINSGGTYETCKAVCVKCPSSSDATDEMSDKFRNCVSKYVNQGITVNDAKQKCNNYCLYSDYGSTIIYRTISLTNPFPSYNADDTITQNITRGMFSSKSESSFSGRYPGYNWNGTNVVTSKILKNRNVSDNKVYNKTPLYKFVLDSSTIKQIREYNTQQKKNNKGGYADFTLECYKNHSSACVSSFVHNSIYGLKSGKCSVNLKANKGNIFYTCAEQWDGD